MASTAAAGATAIPCSSIVVSDDVTGGGLLDMKKYGSAIIIVILIVVVSSIAYYKQDGFISSPDGVVARKSNIQVRSDTEVDRSWNLKQLEKSVALINRQATST
jgi:uncharacterized membrane protein YdbT with pleckstrin-like domain